MSSGTCSYEQVRPASRAAVEGGDYPRPRVRWLAAAAPRPRRGGAPNAADRSCAPGSGPTPFGAAARPLAGPGPCPPGLARSPRRRAREPVGWATEQTVTREAKPDSSRTVQETARFILRYLRE